MNFELHLSVAEMNLLIPAIDNYIQRIQTSNAPSEKANAKSKVEKLKKTGEKLKLLVSYAKTSTQAEKTRKQAEAKKRKYLDMVFGTGKYNSAEVEKLLSGQLDGQLSIDDL